MDVYYLLFNQRLLLAIEETIMVYHANEDWISDDGLLDVVLHWSLPGEDHNKMWEMIRIALFVGDDGEI